jgi:DNA polymerase-3 subunit alpha
MYQDSVTNSGYIADMINVELELHQNLLPTYNCPSGMTASAYLKELTIAGMQARYGTVSKEATMRMYYELEVIERTGFDSYMLIIADLQRYAHGHAMRCGPGRGSAAGSIVSYALGITNVDPLKFGLIFERFLNMERVKMPDIDLDYADTDRATMIKYAVNTYGADKVAQIVTVGQLAARSAIKGVGASFGIAYVDADRLAKLIPYDQFGADLGSAIREPGEIKTAYERGGWEKAVLDTAIKLEGVARHSGTHAAGVIISPVPLADVIPLQRPSANDVTSIVAHYEDHDLEKVGLLKVDILGIKTLGMITDVVNIVNSHE